MKKETLVLLALILIPLFAVGIAISPASVTVIQDQTVTTMSFAQTYEAAAFGWCAPVALVLTYALFAAVVIYAVSKKLVFLKVVRGISFVAMSLAVLPIMVKSDVLIVPNAFVGLLLGVQWAVSHFALKNMNQKKEQKPKGKRL